MSQSVNEDDEFRLLFHINCSEDDKQHFLTFKDSYEELALKEVHCNICLNHIGTRDKENIVTHQFLQITICNACHEFYTSGEFEKDDDGLEFHCRWCGQGGKVLYCSREGCIHVFCVKCIKKTCSRQKLQEIESQDWLCFLCDQKPLQNLRARHWALMNYLEKNQQAELDDMAKCCRQSARSKNSRKSVYSRASLNPRRESFSLTSIGQRTTWTFQDINNETNAEQPIQSPIRVATTIRRTSLNVPPNEVVQQSQPPAQPNRCQNEILAERDLNVEKKYQPNKKTQPPKHQKLPVMQRKRAFSKVPAIRIEFEEPPSIKCRPMARLETDYGNLAKKFETKIINAVSVSHDMTIKLINITNHMTFNGNLERIKEGYDRMNQIVEQQKEKLIAFQVDMNKNHLPELAAQIQKQVNELDDFDLVIIENNIATVDVSDDE